MELQLATLSGGGDSPFQVTQLVIHLARRASQSAVIWTLGMNGLRLASSLILLPLLLSQLAPADLGMHFLLVSLGALAPLLDLGFSSAIWRAVCHAQAGGKELPVEGLDAPPADNAPPNRELLWGLLDAARQVYQRIAWLAVLLLGSLGTLLVSLRIEETTTPAHAWLAWGVALLAAAWEVYAGWWGTYLMGLNRMVTFAQINFSAYLLKLGFSAGLLWAGAGLSSVPCAGLLAVLVQRTLARRECLRLLPGTPPPLATDGGRELVARLWPNASRTGLVALGGFFSGQALLFISSLAYGLATTAQFGLSLQIITVSQGLAAVWTQVKWPELAQRWTRGDLPGVRQVLGQRLWLAVITFTVLAGGAVALAPSLVHWLAPDKAVLAPGWLALMALNGLLDLHLACWGMLIFTGNRVTYWRHLLWANGATFGLAAGLVWMTDLGLGALVIAPLITGCAFNYWHWPRVGSAMLQTTWSRLFFGRRVD